MSHPTDTSALRYTGRFAPSPTGPLHFGSLVAALGSYLRARSVRGRWLVRMEDIDPPREVAGAADDILRALEAFGFEWDETVLFQSTRLDAYAAATDELLRNGGAYFCTCSRKEVADRSAAAGLPPGIYPGTCRGRRHQPRQPHAIRVQVEGTVEFEDLLQGAQRQALTQEVGDFVVRRADGLFAYQLAVVVDDAMQGVTEVVRGADLLDSTARQIHLQRLLGLPKPGYLHLPVAVDGQGNKLSKQTHAPPIDPRHPIPVLYAALAFLGQQPPSELLDGDLVALWRWAVANFSLDQVPSRLTISVSGATMAPQ